MSNYKQKIGRWGEQTAADYLTNLGYEILERNLRTPYGEIDIVTRFKGITIFVEVKSRTSRKFGLPEDAINANKQAHLQTSAEYYAQQHKLNFWQIDAIAVEGRPGQTPEITHFENVLG